jgi:hypothetical protein
MRGRLQANGIALGDGDTHGLHDCKRRYRLLPGWTMIIPTPEFDPVFADDGVPFRTKMIEYIRRELADLLGPHIGLLEAKNGLDLLAAPDRSADCRKIVRKAA